MRAKICQDSAVPDVCYVTVFRRSMHEDWSKGDPLTEAIQYHEREIELVL